MTKIWISRFCWFAREESLKHTPMCALQVELDWKRSTQMRDGAVQLTTAGRARLEDELTFLRDVKRRELSDRLEDSNEDGDISDNSEYEDLKEELVLADRRIQELEYLLATAAEIEPSQDGSVALGSVVTIKDSYGEEMTWTLVDPAEADTRTGSISTESPVGRALMGCHKGDSATVETPGGQIVYTVLNVA
jgi:transcription elongation factor GreA